LFEFIQGDVYELYAERVRERGRGYANRAFYWDVLRFFRPSNFRQPTRFKRTIMIKNYLKVGFRNLRKNWTNSLINISGLTLSVGCAITTFLFADFFFHLNSIHENLDHIYQVVSHIEENQKEVRYGPSPLMLADRIREDIPDVEEVTRVQYKNGNVKYGHRVFRERIQFADPSFLDIFDFPVESGVRQQFEEGAIFISHDIATKYFGYDNPVGQRMDIKFGEERLSFNVGGVFASVPANTTFKPKLLLNFDTYLQLTRDNINWVNEAKATFVLLKKHSNQSMMRAQLKAYQIEQNQANTNQPVQWFELMSFTELNSRNDIQDSIVFGNSKSGTIGIAVTGLLLILFASLNYINISISSSSTRLKEIGVRKVMGGSRAGIAQQFLTENFLTCAIAMVLGVVACYFLLLPGFNKLSPVPIPFAFSSLSTAVIYFLSLFLLLGLLSGAYPSFYISRFQSLKIFKGEQQMGGKKYLSRILLTGQFTLVFVTILGCFVFTDNAQYVKQLSWGYEPEGILSMPIADQAHLELMEAAALRHPDINAVATSNGHLGVQNKLISFDRVEDRFKVLTYQVTPGYTSLMGVPLVAGRYFNAQDRQGAVIVNQLFVDEMKWEEPIGEVFDFQGDSRTVVGVVSDVYHVFFDDDIQRPMIFSASDSAPNFLVLKADPSRLVEVNQFLREQWREVAPFDPFVSYFQADSFDRKYSNVDANIWFMATLSVMTIFLSCLGLYGLLAFTLQHRIREFSIRKVLGASSRNIIMLANREFIWIMVISFGIGAPLGIWVMQGFVESFFTVSKPLGVMPVFLGLVITVGTIALSVFGQIRKVTKVNPADVLKGE
ncbi:MAG: ABC transporter permease, partial [Bacteroidota bacterium]